MKSTDLVQRVATIEAEGRIIGKPQGKDGIDWVSLPWGYVLLSLIFLAMAVVIFIYGGLYLYLLNIF